MWCKNKNVFKGLWLFLPGRKIGIKVKERVPYNFKKQLKKVEEVVK
jgi:hypothetical protein